MIVYPPAAYTHAFGNFAFMPVHFCKPVGKHAEFIIHAFQFLAADEK